jgi:hypothetical protein
MKWLKWDRLILAASLLIAVLCLILYTEHLWRAWGPVIHSQSWGAPRLTAPVARDFPLHWTASYLALAGEPTMIYNEARLKEAEQALTGLGGHPWPYPPTALLIDLPLSLLPYFLSLAAWLAVTMGLYLLVLYCLAPHPLTLLWSLAFFGTFENFYFGQNGFLSAALLGGGLLLLDNSPLLGGVLLGLLSYKPHLAALIPLALLAGGRWRALAGAGVAAVCLVLASLWAFPVNMWGLFLHSIPPTMARLYGQALWFYKMPTVFAAVRLAGFGVPAAWVGQSLAMAAAVILVVWLWRAPASPAVRASGLIMGILLFSPHIWYYDLPLLAIPLAWLWWEGHRHGWLPLEQMLLFWSWFLPLVSFFLSVELKWPTGPLYLIPLLVLVLRRFHRERHYQTEEKSFVGAHLRVRPQSRADT